VQPARWPAVEGLWGRRGGGGGGWCWGWARRGGNAGAACRGEPNRRDFRDLVLGGSAHGALAFADKEPVGWCNFGPREDYFRLVNSRVLQRSSVAERWAITCFFVRRGWARRGVAQLLLEAATREAFRRGAEEVEGYPKTYGSSDNSPAAFVWTGLPRMFEAAEFSPTRAIGSTRNVYVKRQGALKVSAGKAHSQRPRPGR